MQKKTTIKDVAKDAGVSTTTVSYVINGQTNRISAETTAQVQASIQKLNYVPNVAAQSLGNNHSRLIGIVIPQTEHSNRLLCANPFYGSFLRGFEFVSRQNGYHILVSGTDANEDYLRIVKKRNLDGVVIVGAYPEGFFENFRAMKIPVVTVDSYGTEYYFHSVMINDRLGGYLATKHLLENNHICIAFVSGQMKEQGVIAYRYQGYMDALAEYQITVDKQNIFSGEVSYEFGVRIGKKIAATDHAITAVVATADLLAIGVIRGLQEAGKNVPDDVSVMGFDDVYLAEICKPPLSTVHQDIERKGEIAAQIIVDDNARNLSGKQEVILPLHIVERGSVRKR